MEPKPKRWSGNGGSDDVELLHSVILVAGRQHPPERMNKAAKGLAALRECQKGIIQQPNHRRADRTEYTACPRDDVWCTFHAALLSALLVLSENKNTW